jgi:hypothetical protein
MEPVFMVLGQSSAVAASMAIDAKKAVQDIDIKKLQQELKTNPLADGSAPEILLDNDQEQLVKVQGDWKPTRFIGFGKDLLVATNPDSKSRITYSPSIARSGKYEVYTYLLPRYADQVKTITWVIWDGKKEQRLNIELNTIQVSGQSSGIWHQLGTYQLSTGSTIMLEGTGEKGLLLADAVLVKPVQ